MRKAILMMLLAVVSGSAAAEWVLLGKSSSNSVYGDPATIRKAGALVKMWNVFDFKTAQSNSGKEYLSVKTQVEYDCNQVQNRSLYESWHTGRMGGGQLVMANSVPSKWMPVPPNSGIELLWKLACGK